ncbi:hypothetical protein [Actinomadura sp. 6N118]|uniref:hypothetical protein n=1 Tax=Actinomadura sp. 6N118 TaxID=3375151 RepID=UPI0037B1FEA3
MKESPDVRRWRGLLMVATRTESPDLKEVRAKYHATKARDHLATYMENLPVASQEAVRRELARFLVDEFEAAAA